MQTILYLAFGRQSFFDEVLFSYLSLRRVAQASTLRAVVYTDNQTRFDGIAGLEAIDVPGPQMREWIGPAGYFYRLKIEVLRDCMQRHPADDVIMLDGDTFFTADPSPTLSKISPSTALMNCPDPGKRRTVATRRVVEASQDLWAELNMPEVAQNLLTWNSGVVGLHSSKRMLLDEILYVNDVLYSRAGIRTTEQIATSIVLQNRITISPMDTELVHYFWAKQHFAPQLAAFMDENRRKSFTELMTLAAVFRPTLVRDGKPSAIGKLRKSWQKRADEVSFRIARFRNGSEWSKCIANSRRTALAVINEA